MRCVDVNVLVYAHRRDAEDHEQYLDYLDRARRDDEPLGVSDLVLSGFIRIVTHPKVFAVPTRLRDAMDFVGVVRAAPAVVPLSPGPRHWQIFSGLCTDTGARGNAVPDAYLAALAIEQSATWVSADRGFSRFPGLRWRHPLAPAV